MNLKARTRWPLIVAVIGFGSIVAFGLNDRTIEAASQPNANQSSLTLQVTPKYQFPENLKFTGINSCATNGCHAGATPNSIEGSEHLIWAKSDPHRRAYSILFNDVSKRMAENLNRTRPKEKQFAAHEDPVCLRCHGVNTIKQDRTDYTYVEKEAFNQLKADGVLADGVSCESCHGAAEKWIDKHYQQGWKSLSHAEKASKYGLYPTKDLNFRVQMCASCHIGHTAGEDVNHDLYAAGHPRLAWEYTLFDVKYPKHWTEKAYGDDFQLRAWAIGQVSSMRSAIQLTRSRAEAAVKDQVVWPEFSEYSCYSCHHLFSYDATTTRLSVPHGDRAVGQLPWNTLYRPMVELLGKEGKFFTRTGFSPKLDAFQSFVKLMEPAKGTAKGNYFPKPNQVVELAKKAEAELDQWLLEMQASAFTESIQNPISPQVVPDLMQKVLRNNLRTVDGKTKLFDADWEWVSQHHLGLSSLYYSSVLRSDKAKNPTLRMKLETIGRELDFPSGYSSPIGYNPVQFPQKLIDLESLIK